MPDSPVKEYKWTHPGGHAAHIHSCVHFLTYGLSYGPADVKDVPVLFDLDLSKHWAPPSHLCDEYTGLHEVLADSFFSVQSNKDAYDKALRILWRELRQVWKVGPSGSCVACKIHCNIGRHRSVAMAERLARTVGRWDGFQVECLHLDILKGMENRAENEVRVEAAEVPEGNLARGRTRSRHQTQAMSETQVSEVRRRRAATTADAVLSPREAPFHEKRVSWVITRPEGERYPRQRKPAGRSNDPWE